MVTVREAAFAVFRHFGVDALFGNPGSTELPMLRAIPEGIDYILGLNEAVVLGTADGHARASGRPALVNLHSSAGTGHALGNLFTAYRNNTPIVVTAGQQARSILPFDPFLGAERPTEFPRPFVKWAIEPARAEDVPLALARAFHIALTPPMGPCFVSIPVDDWDRECEMPDLPTLELGTLARPKALADIAALLDRAKRPAIVLGTGVSQGGWQAAQDLANACAADVWTAPFAARETFPEDHPYFSGFLPAFRDRIVSLLSPYDAIFVAGAPAFTYHAEGVGPHWPAHAELAMLSDDPRHVSALPGGIGVLGDVAQGLGELARLVNSRPARPAASRADAPEPAMRDAYVISRLSALRPAGAILVEEAPTARSALHDQFPITREHGFFTCASGGLGYALPAAIGVARARADDRIIALLGDGSAMYTIQGLWSAAEQKARISFVILNNRRYAALDNFAKRFGLDSLPGTQLEGLDFVAMAQGLGIPARRVERTGDIDAALAWSFASQGPTLVDMAID